LELFEIDTVSPGSVGESEYRSTIVILTTMFGTVDRLGPG